MKKSAQKPRPAFNDFGAFDSNSEDKLFTYSEPRTPPGTPRIPLGAKSWHDARARLAVLFQCEPGEVDVSVVKVDTKQGLTVQNTVREEGRMRNDFPAGSFWLVGGVDEKGETRYLASHNLRGRSRIATSSLIGSAQPFNKPESEAQLIELRSLGIFSNVFRAQYQVKNGQIERLAA